MRILGNTGTKRSWFSWGSPDPNKPLTVVASKSPRVSLRQIEKARAALVSVLPLEENVDLLFRISGEFDHQACPELKAAEQLRCEAISRLGEFTAVEAGLRARIAVHLTGIREQGGPGSFPVRAAAARALIKQDTFSTPAEKSTCLAYGLVREPNQQLAALGPLAIEAIDAYLHDNGGTVFLAQTLGELGRKNMTNSLVLLYRMARNWHEHRPEAAALCQAILENIWPLAHSALDRIIYSSDIEYRQTIQEEAIIFREKKGLFIEAAVKGAINDRGIRANSRKFLSALRLIIAREDCPLSPPLKAWLSDVLYQDPLYP